MLSVSVARRQPAQCRVDMWKSCTVDAIVADGFALTGGAELCARLGFVEIERRATRGWRAKRALLESPLLDATVACDSLASQTS